MRTLEPAVIARLKEAAGPAGYTDDPREIAPHLEEWRGRWHGKSALLLKPDSVGAVSRVLAICSETATAIVPQGGNTGLVGGQIPTAGEVLLSLARMNRIRAVDAADNSLAAEAGCILADVQRAAGEAGRLFPLSLAAEGSCTIGGNLSTNAGGTGVLRYGNARDLVLGLEVVLADGTVLDLMRGLRKDNTGYDLKHIFIGAEGTLGIVTAAVLKLFPKPASHATAFVAVANPAAAVSLLNRLQDATGGLVTGFEIVARIGLDFVLRHVPGTTDPFAARHDWYVLAEISNPRAFDARPALEAELESGVEAGLVQDAVLAKNERERAALWGLRENVSEAQRREGASIKHDISVPVSQIAAFIPAGEAAIRRIAPAARLVCFGHIGDGNLHFNVSVPEGGDAAAFVARREAIEDAVYDEVRRHGGSISAEHGLGLAKRDTIAHYKSKAELDLMRALKRTLDPKGILNPGKTIPGA